MNPKLRKQHRLIGIRKAKQNGVYHFNKLKLTPYNKKVQHAFYDYLHRNKNHMSVQRIADRYGFSRSSFYRIINKYRKPLYNLNFRHNYHTKALSSWQGGKTRLLPTLISNIPHQWDPIKNKLYEAFSGMASLSFLIQPEHLVLNDTDFDLINLYKIITKYPDKFINIFKIMKVKTNEDYFYQIRNEYNTHTYPNNLKRACDFLFLIDNSFNAIVRFNSKRRINSAYNTRQNHTTVSLDTIKNDATYLNKIHLHLLNTDYQEVFNQVPVKKHDLIYFDPPYDNPKNSQYNSTGFSINDQINLAKLFSNLNKQGCYVMESNADTDRIRTLYYGFSIIPIKNSSSINRNGNSRRRKFREVLIKNY